MDISLHLHDPDELKAFARFCNDMADVRVKQRAEKPRDCTAGPALTQGYRETLTVAPESVSYSVAPVAPPKTNGIWEVAAGTLPPPHDSLEEAQRAAGIVPNSAPEGPHAIVHPDPFLLQAFARTADVGATSPAVPLPPPVAAPSTAAVDQFLTAPAAPPAGQALAFPLPVPPSAPSVAAPTAAGTTSPAAVVEIDQDGLPWDQRIHSSSKEKNKDGRWRSKRGLNDEGTVKRIEAELRATMAIPTPLPAVPSVPRPPSAPAVAPSIPLPPAATGSTPSDPTDFASLIAVLTPRLTPDRMPKIFEIVQSFGLPGLPALQQRPDLVPAVWAKLKEYLG